MYYSAGTSSVSSTFVRLSLPIREYVDASFVSESEPVGNHPSDTSPVMPRVFVEADCSYSNVEYETIPDFISFEAIISASAETVNSFNNTRKDLDKIFYSMYITEVINSFGVENDPCAPEIYNILYNALKTIANCENKKDILLAVLKFQLKIMQTSGFLPELNTCLKCGCKINQNAYFSINEGGIICEECLNDTKGKLSIHNKIREFLCYLATSDFNGQTDYEIKATEKVCEVCFNLLKKCIEPHSIKKIKTTDFLTAI